MTSWTRLHTADLSGTTCSAPRDGRDVSHAAGQVRHGRAGRAKGPQRRIIELPGLRHRAYPATLITAVHTIVYADDADAARAFFRDVLGWAHVDAHGGWLIFKTGPSELGYTRPRVVLPVTRGGPFNITRSL